MKTFLVLASILFASLSRASSGCAAPAICSKIQTSFEALQKKSDRQNFRKFVALLTEASRKSCAIKGVRVLETSYRACYDEGFSDKAVKGQTVSKKNLNGQLKEEDVLAWFAFVEKSEFSEGKAFISSKRFQSTLDGYWAEMFSNR
ncbi:MAG: hypothetical protein EOP06_21075 [Proteobacteria bacterium]|nr:MAG: hypothetical protein EOP06_21075 [Pseudomonadota bacterium]